MYTKAALGVPLHTNGPARLGWLITLSQVGGALAVCRALAG